MKHLPNHLRPHRKRWALAQHEMAFLLGLASQTVISHYESDRRRPRVETAIAYQVVFDATPRELFPALHAKIESDALTRAKALQARVEGKNGSSRDQKLRLLSQMISRLESHAYAHD
jgi:DNA-binding XRE family transcriptional regulator